MIVIVVVMVMMLVGMHLHEFAVASIMAMDPVMIRSPMAGHPDPFITIIPITRPVVERSVA